MVFTVQEQLNQIHHVSMGESSKFPKSLTFESQILKLAGWLQKWII